jgi:hypothetical protein
MVEGSFGNDRTARVAGAEKQDIHGERKVKN